MAPGRFEKVCLRYYPGAPLALKYVSFHIKDGEKVGVVGRTGSGKTTLLMALFRMFELAYGRIVIDGCNIANIKLQAVSGCTVSTLDSELPWFHMT